MHAWVCVHACVHACAHLHVWVQCAHMCACLWRLDDKLGHRFSIFMVFEPGSFLLFTSSWFVIFSYLCLPAHYGSSGMSHSVSSFMWGLAIELGSSCLYGNYFHHGAIFQAPVNYFYWPHRNVSWLFSCFLLTWHKLQLPEKRTWIEKILLSNCLQAIFLIYD